VGADPGTLTAQAAGDGLAGDTAWPEWRSWLDAAIRREIDRLRVRYPLSLDEFRGLYVSDEHVDRLLAANGHGATSTPPPIPDPDPETRLGRLGDEFLLSPTEVAVVVVVLAPELDRRYETLFAYLSDDVTRRHATVDICLRLSGARPEQMEVDAPLFADGLLEAVRPAGASPRGSAGVVLRDPARRFLLGGHPMAVPEPPDRPRAELGPVVAAIRSGRLTSVVLAGGFRDEPRTAAVAIAAEAGRPVVEVRDDDGAERLRDALVTARLHGACVYVEVDGPPDDSRSTLVRTAASAPVPALFGIPAGGSWRPMVEGIDHEVVELSPPAPSERARLWRLRLREQGVQATHGDVDAVAGLFSLHPGQIRRAALRAGRLGGGAAADLATLASCARGQSTAALEDLAEHVALVNSWSDLVLPSPTLRRLREFADAVRARATVFHEWSFLKPAGGTASLRALFSGSSGTGKTMSAAVVARDLGLDLYRIDLSAVVSKYIGETEKNLERIFTAAEGSNAILLFDEADALFGKRSEVKDAHDRYANIEVAYLLQRMETYDGVLILATNLAKYLDEAFSRRIHFDIEFPLPDQEQRERLWRLLIPAAAPTSDDVDPVFLARQFQLTGGEIRNCALAAAFLAAHEGGPIAMRHLVRAVARQRRKQGKIPTVSEFRHHLGSIHEDGA